MQYHNILRDYLRDYAIPAMLEQGWAFKPAKSYGWEKAQRGADFHVDQPLRTHILNGLYALTRVLDYLAKKDYFYVNEGDFKRTLVLYTMHDAYKDFELASTRKGNSDFGIPLAELDKLLERMRLRQFVPVKAEDIRAASVALLSQKVADISSSSSDITQLLTLVHLADAFASQQTARDYKTAENRLQELSRNEAIKARRNERVSKRITVSAPSNNIPPPLKLYYHELDDYRGLSTLLIHQATEELLANLDLYPVLYFPNGVLYVGPTGLETDVWDLRTKIATRLFTKVRQEVSDESLTVAKDACDPRKGMKIEKYAYLFCSLDKLLEAVIEKTRLSNARGFASSSLPDYANYAIPPQTDRNPQQAEYWLATTKLVMAAENIAQAVVPGNILEWLFATFNTPSHVATSIREHASTLRKGGVPNYCIILAYHWLIQARFTSEKRTWLEMDTAGIQHEAKALILRALKNYDKEENFLAFAEKELGIQGDAKNYLQTTLVFSFDPKHAQDEDPLHEYEKERRRSHKRLCTICNRLITSQVSKKSTEIKTTIAEQPAQIFSNRRVPTEENKNDMMVWCPMCYLEFMLRRLSGQSYPAGSNYNTSYRLNLYILPDYSFTPELWTDTGQGLLREFHPRETTVSKLVLRGGKGDPSLPRRWLEHHTVDEAWLEQVSGMFAEQAASMKTRGKFGDRLIFSFMNPNYMLFTYDNVVSRSADSSLEPTHIEVWAKALYAATLIHLLTGARVYITDKPYLTFTRPEQMKTIIEMEGLHPLLYGLQPVRRTASEATNIDQRASESSTRMPLAVLPTMLDLLAAIWEVNAALYQGKMGEPRNLDKQVASVLEEINTNYLAGATLYKMRERDKAPPYEAFTRACQILLPRQGNQAEEVRRALYMDGYELMMDKEGGDLMNLVQRITDTSLKLYSPSAKPKGRAHRFETLFRTGVEAIKSNASIDEEELVARVAGSILKRLERIREGGGYCPAYGTVQLKTATEFSELLVKRLFSERYEHSVSKLTHEENHLADAIYYLTFLQVSQYREEHDKQHSKEASGIPTSNNDDLDEN